MSDSILVALITGGITLFGSVLTIIGTSRKQQHELDKAIAVIETKMTVMQGDIRSHNEYARMFSENIPALKQHMEDVDKRLDRIDRRMTA